MGAGEGGSDIVRPSTEQRGLQFIRLENGLKVLLVSDPEADKAGASLDVNVGSRQDPRDYQGLAHFLEHMLFLGTEAYPQAGDYQAFITANGGSHNAFTSFEHTNYFFEVKAEALEGALDQFSQFFVAPLFNAEYVQREVNAVESEYRARLRNDRRRELAVFKQQLSVDHPFNKFSVGNLQTLQAHRESALRQQLLDFYQRYYSANIMSLVVVGRESLAELEAMVRARFSAIANRRVEISDIETPLFDASRLPRWITVKPVKNERRLSLQFPVADASEHWRDKPLSYIGNLLGHEGPGSLLSLLKAKGWADGLSAGQSLDMQGQAMFGVNVALTKQGLSHADEVLEKIFGYISLIRERGIEAWRYEEQAQLAQQQFRFRNRQGLTEELVQLSSALQDYPAAEVLRAGYLMAEFRPEVIASYLDSMTVDRAFISLVAPEVETDKRVRRYDVAWGERAVDEALLQRWRNAAAQNMALPPSNPYIASEFALKSDPLAGEAPRRVAAQGDLWLFNDSQFSVPKGRSYVLLESIQVNASAHAQAATELWLRMVNEELNEQAYAAHLAGLSYQLKRNWAGLELSLGGFDQQQAELLSSVLGLIRRVHWDEQRFSRVKDQRLRELENARKRSPYQQLFAEAPRVLQGQPALAEQLAVTQALTMAAVARHADRVLADFRYRVLLHGNFTTADAEAFSARIAKVLPQPGASRRPVQRLAKLPSGRLGALVAAEHSDAGLLYYIQAPSAGKRGRVALGVAAQLMSADFYHQLRTEKQLGYIVSAGVFPQRDVGGLFFLVQSPVADAQRLAAEIDGYVEGWLAKGVDEKSYQRYRDTLIAKLEEQPENVWEAADRHWRDVLEGYDNFDSRQQLIATLRALSWADWWQLVGQTLAAPQRRALLLVAPGQWPAALPETAALGPAEAYQQYEFE